MRVDEKTLDRWEAMGWGVGMTEAGCALIAVARAALDVVERLQAVQFSSSPPEIAQANSDALDALRAALGGDDGR
jgi:hypothetical protein